MIGRPGESSGRTPLAEAPEPTVELLRRQLRVAHRLGRIGTWTLDADTGLVDWSPELVEIIGLQPDQAPTRLADSLSLVHHDDRPRLESALAAALQGGDLVTEFRVVGPDGIRWLRCRGERDESRPRVIRGACQDITERKLAEANLTHLALHDSLTGLANRALFVDRLDLALSRLERTPGTVAVLFIDLDRFKLINDSAGHFAGDRVLVAVAERLTQMLRPADSLARFGGDEFAILCEGLSSHIDAVELARRVLELIAPPIVAADGQIFSTGASIGIALTSDPSSTTEGLLRDADAAMYQAKEAGRNRFAVFDNDSRLERMARLQLAEELQLGVARGEFVVFYQPVMDLREDRCVGVEALVRWNHPSRGLLAPGEFIAVAEETGAIVPLGEWVLAEACREAARQEAAPGRRAPFVAVNLSARQLNQPTLVESLRRALRETGIDPSRLLLEVTESLLMEDLAASVEALLALKVLGVHIAVDDFGTGYSSLSYLRKLPIDAVKIDRAFVEGVGVNPADDAIVAAVVNLSHALGLRIVAEGVETEDQLVAVRALGCDQAQGFFWSQPQPAASLGSWSAVEGKTGVEVEPVDLYSLLVERTDALRAASGRPVVLQAPQRLASASADLGGVKTILSHLLGNAVKYSDPDRPIVVSAASDRNWVRVSVADFGAGMTTEESARCFEQFWQAPEPSDTGRGGTGIGLYIVRSLVEAMGGHVGVKSAKGKGSTFTFALPRSSRSGGRRRPIAGVHPDVGEDSTIREFMRHIGVPNRRGS